MHVAHLSLHDFRSYPEADVALGPGVTSFVGRNGQGKTNLVEAVDYIARLASHRVAGDAPLVRFGAEHAVVRAVVVRDGRQALLEVQINPGRSNRARLNRSPLPRARELLGLVRTVLFSPEDLALVKGDPSERRHFLDELLVQRAPRFAGVRADYDRVLKQRNSLLKTARPGARGPGGSARREALLATLEVWNSHLARTGAELLSARLSLVDALRPHVATAYEAVAQGATRTDATMSYKPSLELPLTSEGSPDPDREQLAAALLAEVERRRDEEIDRGVSLVGPHRDDLTLMLGPLPVKGYASHGESWSTALALRLASYELLRATGDDPVLILDDVFAELDSDRRDRLAALVAEAEQVLVTAAVPDDIPAALAGVRLDVVDGKVLPGAA
ncbi:MAG TPA: DNA replication/repair protein RecF [Nocardioidaceae bacterium]|nr:DNA replication/repair protein RecF [Nocardioidaceae bacterium]